MASLLLSSKSVKIWKDTTKDKGPNPTRNGRKKKNKQTTEKLEQRIHHAKVGKIKVPFAEEKSLLTYRGFGGTPKDQVTSGSRWLSLGTATAIQQQNPAGLFLCAPGRLPGNLLLVNLFKQDSRNRDVMHLEEFCIIFNFITA